MMQEKLSLIGISLTSYRSLSKQTLTSKNEDLTISSLLFLLSDPDVHNSFKELSKHFILNGECYSGLMGFWTLSIIRYHKGQ
jgi:hypothetical protein